MTTMSRCPPNGRTVSFWVTVEEADCAPGHNRAEVFHSYQAAVTHAWEVRADGRRVAVVDFEGWDLPPNGLVIEPAAIVGRAVGVIDLQGRVWVKPPVNRFATPAAVVEDLADAVAVAS